MSPNSAGATSKPASVATSGQNELREAAAGLMLDLARLLAPHFGPSGSMDLDLRDWPTAQGPSYYNQFSHHAFLLLATGEVPGATAAERENYARLALRNIEYVLAITDENFHTPHYSRGREWGPHIGEWLNYYLLCSLEVMERHGLGSEPLRARLSAAVSGAVGALHARFVAKYRETPREFVGNHDTWHGLLFYHAGRHYGRADWVGFARDFFARFVLPFQTADGYWPEGHGIVVGYSLVTAEAVSLYAEMSGDSAAQASIGRFAGFLDALSFPDGSASVALDVRMRYHASPFMFMPPGFLRSPAGRELVKQRIPFARTHVARSGVRDNAAQGFAFYGSFAAYVFAPASFSDGAFTLESPRSLPAARLAAGDWRAYLAWQVVPEHPSRFVLDTQNFIELWHRAGGYLAGTGGSKHMPRFSTIRRTNAGRAYVPDSARCIHATTSEAEVGYRFGSDEIVVQASIADGKCRVNARVAKAEAGADYEFGLVLALRPGDTLDSEHGSEKLDPTVLIHQGGGPRPQQGFKWRGLVWQLPAGSTLDYPIVPHNSYTQDGLPAREDYVGRISFPLTADAKVITIG